MIWSLFGVGLFAALIGGVLLYLDIGGKVSADTQFGEYSGEVGAVALILGIVLMAIAALV